MFSESDRLAGRYRQDEGKSGTAAHFAYHFDTAPVGFHEMLCDCQSESCATHLTGSRVIYAVKSLENSRLVRLGDTDASVLH